MKNKKAFTLIEVLGVILILALLTLIIYPVVNNAISSNKEKVLKQQINILEDAAYKWSIKYPERLSNTGDNHISFTTLLEDGIITKIPKNSVTNENLEGCINIKWDNLNNQYTYKYKDICD